MTKHNSTRGVAPCDVVRVAEWPKERRVGRREDMSPTGKLEVMLDGDSDVIVHVCKGDTAETWESASVEFCTVGQGGGSSPRTRAALIALMVAIEADNAESPRKAWPPAEGRTSGVGGLDAAAFFAASATDAQALAAGVDLPDGGQRG